jgi:hypothetical protein
VFNEYPQEFIDFIPKPSRNNCPFSDTIYQVIIVIPYIKGISEKSRCIGNLFSIRTIFKSKHTLRRTLMKTGRVRYDQKTKQCVYRIPCDCGRCYITETSRPLEVRVKKHIYNHTRSAWKPKISPTCVRRRPHMFERSEGFADWTKYHIQEIQGIRPHVSDRPSDQSPQLGHLSHLDSDYRSRSRKTNHNFVQRTLSGKNVFLCWYHTKNLSLQRWLLFWKYSGATWSVEIFNCFQYCI